MKSESSWVKRCDSMIREGLEEQCRGEIKGDSGWIGVKGVSVEEPGGVLEIAIAYRVTPIDF